MKYAIYHDITASKTHYICIDRNKRALLRLQGGDFDDITKKCKRMAESKTKRDCAGANWYNSLVEGTKPRFLDIVFETNSAQKYFDKLIELQIDQVRNKLRACEDYNKWVVPHCMGYPV